MKPWQANLKLIFDWKVACIKHLDAELSACKDSARVRIVDSRPNTIFLVKNLATIV